MSGVLERSLGIIELLVKHPEGLSIRDITTALNLPASGTHRLLNELCKYGYVRQLRNQGEYVLTIKMSALGLSFLSRSGIFDIVQPVLDDLAQKTKELVRLSVLDGDQLVWVAVAQGATSGLRYDPDREQGLVVHMPSSSSGQAYLSTLSDDDALMLIAKDGLTPEGVDLGSDAPKSIADVMKILEETRKRGYAVSINSYIEGMAAVAVPIRNPENNQVIGCVSMAGPHVRMPQDRIEEMIGDLKQAAQDIGETAKASKFFKGRLVEKD